MFNRVGGLKEDLPEGWLDRAAGRPPRAYAALLPGIEDATLGDPTFTGAHPRGRVLDPRPPSRAHGVSGPVARASGVDHRPAPRRALPRLRRARRRRCGCAGRTDGDAWPGSPSSLDEVATSLDLVDACVERLRALPPGPVNVRLPKIVKAPEGATYAWTESPGGVNGYYLVSRGEKTPWRLKLRTPGFNNAAALPHVVTGRPGRGPGADPRVDVLRHRRHRQVSECEAPCRDRA